MSTIKPFDELKQVYRGVDKSKKQLHIVTRAGNPHSLILFCASLATMCHTMMVHGLNGEMMQIYQ